MARLGTERDLAYLTGPEAAGRLSGTPGAGAASAYLAKELEALDLEPAGEDGFNQWLTVPAARLTGPVRFTVDGQPYAYRKDFGEMAHLSAGGSLRADMIVVREGQEQRPADLAGKVVLIPERPTDFDLAGTVAAAADVGAAALLVEWGEPEWFGKTIFGSASNRIPVLRIRKSLATHLATKAGAAVVIDLPLAVEALPCRNVLGLLPGHNPAFTVALTAHYDHVGDDPEGERFPGAADNASGVATILAALRTLAERGARLPFNILIGFLTGEESGMWGARHLAAHPPTPLSAVVNLDGMGLEEQLRAIRLGYPGPENWLAELAAAFYQEQGVEVRWTSGGDDATAFQMAGLPALGLGHMPTEPLSGAFHSPADIPEYLHLPVIIEAAESLLALLRRLAAHPALAHSHTI